MPLGYRHFVVLGDDITPLSQKAFEALFRAATPWAPGIRGHHSGHCHCRLWSRTPTADLPGPHG